MCFCFQKVLNSLGICHLGDFCVLYWWVNACFVERKGNALYYRCFLFYSFCIWYFQLMLMVFSLNILFWKSLIMLQKCWSRGMSAWNWFGVIGKCNWLVIFWIICICFGRIGFAIVYFISFVLEICFGWIKMGLNWIGTIVAPNGELSGVKSNDCCMEMWVFVNCGSKVFLIRRIHSGIRIRFELVWIGFKICFCLVILNSCEKICFFFAVVASIEWRMSDDQFNEWFGEREDEKNKNSDRWPKPILVLNLRVKKFHLLWIKLVVLGRFLL